MWISDHLCLPQDRAVLEEKVHGVKVKVSALRMVHAFAGGNARLDDNDDSKYDLTFFLTEKIMLCETSNGEADDLSHLCPSFYISNAECISRCHGA